MDHVSRQCGSLSEPPTLRRRDFDAEDLFVLFMLHWLKLFLYDLNNAPAWVEFTNVLLFFENPESTCS